MTNNKGAATAALATVGTVLAATTRNKLQPVRVTTNMTTKTVAVKKRPRPTAKVEDTHKPSTRKRVAKAAPTKKTTGSVKAARSAKVKKDEKTILNEFATFLRARVAEEELDISDAIKNAKTDKPADMTPKEYREWLKYAQTTCDVKRGLVDLALTREMPEILRYVGKLYDTRKDFDADWKEIGLNV